ncbi:MAG: GGDEF domain-containing protein [Candidatus Sumerlaeota bacterium]|nr:GGDEF domain-containing protein [Candidatus Sumerlaeota bacterium]
MNIVKALEKHSRLFWGIVGGELVLVLGVIDYLTGYEISFSLFYLAPIVLVTWFVSRRLGIMFSIFSAITWYFADALSGQTYSLPAIYLWNTLIRFGFFIIVTLLLSALREKLRTEEIFARTDFVTGAVNTRYFYNLAHMEISRSRRYQHPFTLAYIDLDNFKAINDRFGHGTGDMVLKTVASALQHHLRDTDIVARFGGDEFALLLTETGQEAAKVVISKIHSSLMAEMQKNSWPVTFSIGVVTYVAVPHTVDNVVKIADELMYSVKSGTKNGVRYSTYTG